MHTLINAITPSSKHNDKLAILSWDKNGTDIFWPPIKWQKEKKLANLVTYALTINQVPHVFGDYYFAGHKHKYMENFTKRRFPNTDLCKRIRETPIKIFQTRQNTTGHWSMSSPEPTTRRRWQSGSVRGRQLPRAGRSPVGASWPFLPLAVAWTHAEVVHHVSPRQR
jgi:hypothetical protein